MLRTTAFAALCVMLVTYSVFQLDNAYSTFAAPMPDPAGSRQVIHQDLDPIGQADAYALSQAAPAAGSNPTTPASRRANLSPAPQKKNGNTELLRLLSSPGAPEVPTAEETLSTLAQP